GAVDQRLRGGEVPPSPPLAHVLEDRNGRPGRRAVGPPKNPTARSDKREERSLARPPLFITGELDLRIRHCLLALPGQALDAIHRAFSHPQALAQCDAFLRQHGLEPVPAYDTAGSAKMVADQRLRGAAAIAGRGAARIYGLSVLAEGIETNPANYTKFLSLAPEPAPPIAGAKTSVVFTTQNVPGALYQALGAFATRSINLTKLESRPRRQVPWEYVFYADFEGHQDDPPIQAALHDLSRITTFLRILGSYPKSPTP